MEFSRAFKRPFSSINKLLIGILLSIIPIVRFFALGYIVDSAKKNKLKKTLEWKNWGELFVKGLLSCVIGLLYMIPSALIMIIGAGATIMSLVRTYVGRIIPIGMIEQIAAGEISPKVLEPILQNTWGQAIPSLMNMAPIAIIAGLVAILAGYLIPMAILNYVNKGSFGKAFSMKEVFQKSFTAKYFVAWIVTILVFVVASAIFNWISILGIAATFYIANMIGFTLMGEAY